MGNFADVVYDERKLYEFVQLAMLSSDDITIGQLFSIYEKDKSVKEVRTYDGWRKINRQVSFGEKGIAYVDKKSTYRSGLSYAFDIRQTKGLPRPKKRLTEERFNQKFAELCEFYETQTGRKIEYAKAYLQYLFGFKEKETDNGAINQSIESNVERADENGTRLDDRRNLGNRRVSQRRKDSSAGDQISFFDGAESTDRQIRVASGRVLEIGELSEVRPLERPVEIGREPTGDRPEGGNILGRDGGSIPSTEGRDNDGVLSSSVGVQSNGTVSDIRRDYKAVRYELSEDDFIHRGPKERYRDNVAAIKLIKSITKEEREATQEEQKILAKYVGWGGLPDVFSDNPAWANEHKELKELLTDAEYEAASGSVLNAHFTPKGIIDGIYDGLRRLGVKKGRVLEPSCGTGNFIGCVPSGMDLQFDAVELDELTAQIAKALYPTEKITQSGFEEVKIKDNTYDVVIGNVPFGDYRVYDDEYNRHKFVIHDYFIAKSLDKLRPGGIMAIITGAGTLDKQGTSARKYFAERAELLGAFRLPNTTFKSNAGTEAVADILFFQKRQENIPSSELATSTVEWLNTTSTTEGNIPLSGYYNQHEDHVLGKFVLKSGRFGTTRTVEPTSDDISTQLKNAVAEFLPQNVYQEVEGKKKEENSSLDIAQGVYTNEDLDRLGYRNFGFCVVNNRAYIRQNDELIEPLKKRMQGELQSKTAGRLNAYIALRDQVRVVIDVQSENCSDEVLSEEQEKLNTLYDDFVKKYGYIGDSINEQLLSEDIDYPLVSSVERYDDETKVATKREIFSERTIRKVQRKAHTDDVFEALTLSRGTLGEIDIRYIEKLTGLAYDEIITKLEGTIYQDPYKIIEQSEQSKYEGWYTREEYLSGDVAEKLETAKHCLKTSKELSQKGEHPEDYVGVLATLEKNVSALEEVQPKRLTSVDIKARIGATWIEGRDYVQFFKDIMNIGGYSEIEVLYNAYDGQFAVNIPSYYRHRAEARNIWGTERMTAVDLFECALNSRTPTVWDKKTDIDGRERRVVNKAETAVAREKLRALQEEFAKWIWRDSARKQKYENIYNRRFNSVVLPEYSGEHLRFDGMNAAIELREHQKVAIARITSGKNALLHHGVGAGKTFEVIAGAMKMREYGIATKPMIVVPNPLVMQWARDVKTLYPNAKVLVTTKEEFEKKNRRRFISKIATGDWDMVIISESQFRRIPVSPERQLKKLEEIIDRIQTSIEEKSYTSYRSSKSLTVKALQATLKKKRTKYKELQVKTSKIQDDIIPFEKLGVDYLFVDEAHTYKNKEIETSMRNVAGITNGGSERAFDLEMKIDYLSELHGGDKGVVFATGTPISNSMAEMYTMQSYLAKTSLRKAGIEYFDAWASTFGEVVTSWELNTSGSGVKARTRFSRFVNLPELQKMYRSFADVKVGDILQLPVPKANRHTITLPATEQILALNDDIIARGERIERGGVDPSIDNMLKLTSDGKKLALDPRCLDATLEDEEGTKVNACIRQVFDIYERTKADKLTQVIFCDQSTPKQGEWSVYQDIKDKLIALGVEENEIAFIHDADTDAKKEKLFKELNAGRVRVLVGSTQKCGVGANFQEKLKALHHLDVPYRPSDMEQREGRIIRQKNSNEEVDIYSYITEKTFDSYSYQILETKQRFISQINKGDMTIREASDIDETTLSFAQIKAIATANPDFLRQMELINEIKTLRMLKNKHAENQEIMRAKLTKRLPDEIRAAKQRLAAVQTDIETRLTDNPKIIIAGLEYEERAKAGEAFTSVFRKAKDGEIIGQYGNLSIVAHKVSSFGIGDESVSLRGDANYNVDLGESGLGNITRIENEYKHIPKIKDALEQRIESLEKQLLELAANVDKPFEKDKELKSYERELAEIEERLQVNKDEVVDESESVGEEEKTNERDEVENE